MTGFRILSCPNPTNWRPIPVDDFQLEHRPRGTPIVGICGDTGTTLRLQYHEGVVEYDYRPTAESLDAFYRSAWMGQTLEQVCATAQAVSAREPSGVRWNLLEGLNVDSALDVGAGYGDQIRGLQRVSKAVRVVEPCSVRAKALAEVYGIETLHGSFPDVKCEADLIVCHHVIEHVHDAEKVFAAFAECQQTGGRLVITCPNFIGEPSMGVCLFYPHLRSFTVGGLITVAHRLGYEVELDLSSQSQIAIRFVKQSAMLRLSVFPNFGSVVSKLVVGLCLSGPRYLGWERDYDGAAQFGQQFAAMQQRHGGIGRTLEIDDITERKTDCPIEIQWADSVTKVFVK